MAERDQPVRALGRHDAGEPRGAQHVALHGIAGEHQVERFLAHDHAAFRDGDPFGRVLGGDIDHARLSALVDMGEFGVGDRRALSPSSWRAARARLFVWPPRRFFLRLATVHSAAARRGARARSARVAAVTSACRIRLSPTRKVEDADARQPREIGRRIEPAFGDDDALARNFRRQPLAHRERGLERAQVAVVDADQARLELERARKLVVVVDFEQHVHAVGEGRILDRLGRRIVDRRHDDQNAIGAERARFHHLIGLVDEILAQRGQGGGVARAASGIPACPGTTAHRSSTDRQVAPPAS